jgi:predicted porin
MKKTLIALAALASTAAFAQSTVNLTGKLRFAYESTTATAVGGAETKTSGLRVTDGDFVLTAVEDLGGGLKASATMAVQSRGRSTAIAGRDASVSLMGGFGTVTVGAVEAGNGIIGLGGAGAPVYAMDDGVVLDGGTLVDILSYTSPAFSGFTFTANMTDGSTGTLASAAGTGGMEKSATTTDATTIGVRYAAGPIAAAFDVTGAGQNSAAAANVKSRMRVSASYDLGVAKLGFGYQTRKTFAAGAQNNKQMIVGVSAPVGPVTVGFNYATRKEAGATASTKGTDLGVKYDLSKRTYVAFHLQNVKLATTAKTSKYRVQLAHAF